jgi:hypothetical protein
MPLDLNSTQQSIQGKINAYKTFKEVSTSEKTLLGKAGNAATNATSQISSQLDKISETQKRFQRNPPNSMDDLLGFIGLTQGNGSATLKYLRTKILETAAKIEPKIAGILENETIKALGCSVEQTYNGVSSESLLLQPLPLRPQQEGIYIPVSSIDFFANLKQSPETKFGKVYYEKPDPSADPTFRPYGGRIPFPMNKQLFNLMTSDNQGRSYSQINGQNYKGKSGQPLFDLQYTNTNSFGVTGDYYRVILLDREEVDEQGNKVVDEQGNTVKANNVGQFIGDYYRTIKIVDSVDIGAQIVNILSGAININTQIGFGELDNQSRFSLIVSRILGLCFDNRREIDVSGVSKVAELDGVDDSFFELNEIDLRNIEVEISNVQNGIIEFEDCDNIKLPVDSEVLMDQLIEFRNSESGDTIEAQVAVLGQIIDSISDNPDWSVNSPSNLNVKISIDKNVIKKIPLAVFSALLTPKNLLPLYTLLSVVQSGATFTYNQAVTEINENVNDINSLSNPGADVGSQGSNIVNSGEDFLKKYKTFAIEVISQINSEFLRTLYEILKKDIVNLLQLIITDISRSKLLKKYAIIIRIAQLAVIVAQLINDFRRCKSLLDNILLLLNLVGQGRNFNQPLKSEIPSPLLLLASVLPGYSPERATINSIEILQSLGIPTGTLPDGSPNLMLLYNLATNKAVDREESENGKVEVAGLSGLSFGKKL